MLNVGVEVCELYHSRADVSMLFGRMLFGRMLFGRSVAAK
jgi:hypothetical protein